jgi:hypothetical protein
MLARYDIWKSVMWSWELGYWYWCLILSLPPSSWMPKVGGGGGGGTYYY